MIETLDIGCDRTDWSVDLIEKTVMGLQQRGIISKPYLCTYCAKIHLAINRQAHQESCPQDLASHFQSGPSIHQMHSQPDVFLGDHCEQSE